MSTVTCRLCVAELFRRVQAAGVLRKDVGPSDVVLLAQATARIALDSAGEAEPQARRIAAIVSEGLGAQRVALRQ